VETQNFIRQDILYVEPASPSADEQVTQELTSSTSISIGQMDLSTSSTALTDDSEDEQVAANRRKRKQGLDRFHVYENAEPFAFLGLAQLFQALAEPIKHAPTYRTQYRILLKEYGWPVKYAASLQELVCTIKEAVRGKLVISPAKHSCQSTWGCADHRDLYMKGTLHRDISQGNIIIIPEGNDVEATKGALIDLDSAKKVTDRTSPALFRPLGPECIRNRHNDWLCKTKEEIAQTFGSSNIWLDDKILDASVRLLERRHFQGVENLVAFFEIMWETLHGEGEEIKEVKVGILALVFLNTALRVDDFCVLLAFPQRTRLSCFRRYRVARFSETDDSCRWSPKCQFFSASITLPYC